MNTDDLKPGVIYRLTQDVENPKPDRRVARDWTKDGTVPAGTRFVCRRWPLGRFPAAEVTDAQRNIEPLGNGEVLLWVPELHILRYGAKGGSTHGRDDLRDALLPHLEAEPESLGSIMQAPMLDHVGAKDILCALLDAGVIDLDHVKMAQRHVVALDDTTDANPRWDALRERHGL